MSRLREHSATTLFFYGTLMDADVRRAVMGQDFTPEELVPAMLAGWRRVAVAGRPYPTLVPHRTGSVTGMAALAVDPGRLRLLSQYEGPQYRLRAVRIGLQDGNILDASTYICPPGRRGVVGAWRLSDWLRRHKSACLARIRLNGRA